MKTKDFPWKISEKNSVEVKDKNKSNPEIRQKYLADLEKNKIWDEDQKVNDLGEVETDFWVF